MTEFEAAVLERLDRIAAALERLSGSGFVEPDVVEPVDEVKWRRRRLRAAELEMGKPYLSSEERFAAIADSLGLTEIQLEEAIASSAVRTGKSVEEIREGLVAVGTDD